MLFSLCLNHSVYFIYSYQTAISALYKYDIITIIPMNYYLQFKLSLLILNTIFFYIFTLFTTICHYLHYLLIFGNYQNHVLFYVPEFSLFITLFQYVYIFYNSLLVNYYIFRFVEISLIVKVKKQADVSSTCYPCVFKCYVMSIYH